MAGVESGRWWIYTLLLVDSSAAINATLNERLSFNFIHDVAAVAGVVRFPYVMVVHPSVPAKTVPEFIAYAKASPGKINMGSPGIGTGPHVAGELFKMMAGVDMVHVPYRGGGAVLTDLLGGQVQILFGTTSLSMEYIRAGKLRPLAVTTSTRWEGLPGVPTVGDFVPGYEANSVFGLGAPKNTAAEIIDKLNKEINGALADTRMKARLADLGGTVLVGSPAEFGKLLADETEKCDPGSQRKAGIGLVVTAALFTIVRSAIFGNPCNGFGTGAVSTSGSSTSTSREGRVRLSGIDQLGHGLSECWRSRQAGGRPCHRRGSGTEPVPDPRSVQWPRIKGGRTG